MVKCLRYSLRCLNGLQPYKSQCFRLYHSEKLTARLSGASHSGISDTISEIYSHTALILISQAKSSGLYLYSVTHIRISHCALWKLLVLKCCADYYLKQVLWLDGEQPRQILIFFYLSHGVKTEMGKFHLRNTASVRSWKFVCLVCLFVSFVLSNPKFFHSHNHITSVQKDAYISLHFKRGNCKISAWHKFEKVLKILQIALNC